MGRFFGKNVTKRKAINTLACGEGQFGVRETYDTYFFGIRTSKGRTRDICYNGSISPPSGDSPLLNFNSSTDKVDMIEARKFRIEKDDKTGWYRWTCKDGSVSGIESTRSGAKEAGKKACGIANFDIDEILVTKLIAEYEVLSS